MQKINSFCSIYILESGGPGMRCINWKKETVLKFKVLKCTFGISILTDHFP